jgi:allantoin racemase
MSIRILYQFATAKQKTELGQQEVARRLGVLRGFVSPGVEIEVATPPAGPGSIESAYDEAISVPPLLDAVQRAEGEGFAALIISCFGDPGLAPAREITTIPVLASGLCAMHVACQLGERFAIVSPLAEGRARTRRTVRCYGLETKFAGSRAIGMTVLGLAKDRAATLERAAAAGRLAIEQDGADVLVLGCMSMAFHDVADELQDRLGVPVVNPVPASLAMAELLARTGLSHSKRAYPTPPKMELLA